MEEKIIDLNEFALEKLEMLKVEKEIVKLVKKKSLLKMLTVVTLEGGSLALTITNSDNSFGGLMVIPTIAISFFLYDVMHNYYIKCKDIKQMTKEINKLNARQ